MSRDERTAFATAAERSRDAQVEELTNLRRAVEEYLPHPNGDRQDEGNPDAWNAAMFNLGQLRGERDALLVRRDELLAAMVKLTREVPYAEEANAANVLIAEVGTLRSQLEEAKRLTEHDRVSAVAALERQDATNALLDALALPQGRCVRAAWERACLLHGRTHDVMQRGAFEDYLDDLATKGDASK